MRTISIFAIIAFLLAGAGTLYLYSTDFFQIDRCLDRGGSWHYDKRSCSMVENYKGPR
ncbi:MAG: hypothetical protein AAF067_03405 [Pseudomonadota bacterium]